jgi:glycosyltransferase involved in cell wall biosynthesis
MKTFHHPSNSRINIHIYPSKMTNESRIYKITQSLIEARLVDRIVLIGKDAPPLAEYDCLDESRSIWRVPLTSFPRLNWKIAKVLRYGQWLWKIYTRFRKEPIALINCHSIFDLPVGVLLKRTTGASLIYDTHELETERNGFKGYLQKIVKKMEKYFIHYADYIFVVGDSIKEWYRQAYRLDNIAVVKNIPIARALVGKSSKLRDLFNIPPEKILYIYQGAFLDGRGIDLLLQVFAKEEIHDHIVFMGYGKFKDRIIASQNCCQTVHYLDAVPFQEIVDYTSGADIGISLIENICLSYYYSFPNKISEYLMSGIPCIVSDFPDMGDFVKTHDCGWSVPVDENSAYALIKDMSWDKIAQKKVGVNRLLNRDDFGWEFEKNKMIEVYNTHIKSSIRGVIK